MAQRYKLHEGVTLRLPRLSEADAREASADDLRILLALAESDYAASVEALAQRTGMSLTRSAASLEKWLERGVISAEEPTSTPYIVDDALPRGRASDDARVIAEKKLRGCLDTCSLLLGKQLNPSEVGILVALVNDLGISEYYLTTLLTHCVETLGVRGVKYLEKMAVSLTERGIRSDAALDEYIGASERARSHEGAVRRLYGMGARELTPTERECLIRWFSTYGYDMEIVGIAYDQTVASANKVNIRYTDKILAEWHRLGLKAPQEIEEHLRRRREEAAAKRTTKRKSASAPTAKPPVSFDTAAFFESALKRSYGDAFPADPPPEEK